MKKEKFTGKQQWVDEAENHNNDLEHKEEKIFDQKHKKKK